jgi:hypothetical protein
MKKKLGLGLIFGAGIGLCAGILTSNIAIGLALGTGAGLVLGAVIKK